MFTYLTLFHILKNSEINKQVTIAARQRRENLYTYLFFDFQKWIILIWFWTLKQFVFYIHKVNTSFSSRFKTRLGYSITVHDSKGEMYFTVKPFIKFYCLRLLTMWLRASRPFKTRVQGFSTSTPSASSRKERGLILSGNQEIASGNIRIATNISSYEKLPTRLVVEATGNLLWHYLFQKTNCAIRRKVGHRVIVSCFGQRNMIYKFFINI